MKLIEQLSIAVFACFVAACLHGQSEGDEILRSALQDEMDRSLSELQLEDEPKPYFISYTVIETSTASVSYVLGSHDSSSDGHRRTLSVAVRVGSPEVDNTNFIDTTDGQLSIPVGIQGTTLPIENSYDELRRAIWKATDSAYKRAVNDLTAKKTALENQATFDRPMDFSEIPEPHTYSQEFGQVAPDIEHMSRIAKETSLVFKDLPQIFASSVRVSSTVSNRLYLDSEGNFHHVATEHCAVASRAKTQALDGAQLGDSSFSYSKKCSEQPTFDQLKKSAVDMAEGLIARRSAEPLFIYSGPVLFESEAAAAFVNQVLVKLLGGSPVPETGEPQLNTAFEALLNPFIERLNTRVLPRSLNVINDPLKTEHNGRPLLGSYVVDSEGVPARRTELVSNGILQTLLSTRSPVKGIPSSSGSHRGFVNPLPGNIFIEPQEGLSMADLKLELLALSEDNGSDFALVIRKMRSMADMGESDSSFEDWIGTQMRGDIAAMPAVDVVKVYADGREVALMPMVIVDFVDSHFKDIAATSLETFHYDRVISAFGSVNFLSMLTTVNTGLQGSQQFVSIITPALLFEDMDLRNAVGFKPKLPAVPHPLTNN